VLDLIRLESVTVSYAGVLALENVTWRLRPGTCWSVAGRNGAGKSTFLKLLRGDVWPDAVGGGRRIYGFEGVEQSVPAGLKERIALVSPEQQELYWRREWSVRVRDVIESGFDQTDYVPRSRPLERRQRVVELANELRLSHLLKRDVQMISQGELRRVLVARALVSKPVVLLLDEATQGLDVESRLRLLEFLESVTELGTTSVVYTTHRGEERVSTWTRTLRLENGRVAEGKEGRLTNLKPVRRAASGFGILGPGSTSGAASGNVSLICLRDVNVYLGRCRVLRDLNWTLGLGEHWAVLGPNGSGKSTLLKTIVGDLHAVHGSRVQRFEGEAVSTLWEIRSRVGYLAADFQSAYETDQSVRSVVASGFFASVGLVDTPTEEQWGMVDELLRRLGLGAVSGRAFDTLSYGTRRRVLLGRALVHRPRLVVLDEPFDGLDSESRREWGLLLGELVRAGVQLVMVTHHLEDVPSCFTHALWMSEGAIVETRRLGTAVTNHVRRSKG